ncbi:MAG: hypothetical protein M1820_008588 [Bogoriella megaspora]|nr:MAG: hypothetical protein M1820_008588 [Bogoriella megaspora]
MAALSPSSSPRLPSPPPMAEDQLGPKSPLASNEDEHQRLGHGPDTGASRRIRPGTKAEDMAEGPPLVDLQDIDSAFQLTEHLKSLHYFLTHPSTVTSSVPLDRDLSNQLATPPQNTDRALWLYELCRFLVQRANTIVVALFADSPPCSAITCPEMRASEWQYLCAVHDPPKSCCAIDYCCHTLDWASGVLTSPKIFPSRLSLGTGADGGRNGGLHSVQQIEGVNATHQVRQLTNIFRRVYRIFAHAWFQHREVFWNVEGRTGLYVFFKTVCDVYSLIPEDNYTVPPEAEGIEPPLRKVEAGDESPRKLDRQQTLTMLSRSKPEKLTNENDKDEEAVAGEGPEVAGNQTIATGNTTKRHRQTTVEPRSTVSTVIEEKDEDEEEEHDEATSGEPQIAEKSEEQPPPAAAPEVSGDQNADIPEVRIDAAEDATEDEKKAEIPNADEGIQGDITVVETPSEVAEEETKRPTTEEAHAEPETPLPTKLDDEQNTPTDPIPKESVEDADKGA